MRNSTGHDHPELAEAVEELRQSLRELTVEAARLSAFMLPTGEGQEDGKETSS